MDNNSARTLSENQKRKSISGSRGDRTSTRGLRNVLAKCYRDHWPVVDAESGAVLTAVLDKLLPSAAKPVSNELEDALRKLKGKKNVEERHALQQRMWQENPLSKELRCSLSLGVNNVSRSIEAGELGSLIIAHEADPPILTRHLGALATARHVPFLVLPGLKDCVKRTLKFACLAVGLKKSVMKEDHRFNEIHKHIIDISRKITEKIASRKSRQSSPHTTCSEPHEESCSDSHLQIKSLAPGNIYLKRTSNRYRAFVPGKGRVAGPDTSWPQFLSLSVNETNNTSLEVPGTARTPLGVDDIPCRPSFLQKVRAAKIGAQLKKPIGDSTSSFLSLESIGQSTAKIRATSMEVDTECEKKQKVQKRPTRYFDSELVPLKVKRIQGNPNKSKRSRKKRT